MRKNLLIIIGAMKCGTTSLFHYLSQHPLIVPAKDKEPHFFSDDRVYSKGLEWYESLWEAIGSKSIALEASTTYSMHPKYPCVIERMLSLRDKFEFRFVYILRNPLARIESHMRHLLLGGHVQHRKLIDEYFWFSEYARQLDLFVEAFGRDQIHTMLLEDFQADPQAEIGKVFRFLDIEELVNCRSDFDLVFNSQQTLNLHPYIRNMYENDFIKPFVRGIFSPRLRQKLYKPLSRKEKIRVNLSETERTVCLDRLSSDLTKLSEYYCVDVSKWGFQTFN